MTDPPLRIVAHLDMDAFYASVELLRYPDLRGRAVVIGGGRRHQPEEVVDPATGASTRRYATLAGYVGRGVATTATYEARALGVHSASGLMKAARLAPDAVLLPTDFEQYRHYSRLFKAAVRAIAPRIEDRGIDEIYVDLTEVVADEMRDGGACDASLVWETARNVAQRIKDAVRVATGLSCSIGLAPNKLLAKIASDLEKPNGLVILRETDVATRLAALPARKINGIGPKAAERLARLDIVTIGELARADPTLLAEHFGRNTGAWMHEVAHGRDTREVVTESETQSISRETTFERDLHAVRDRAALSTIFTELCEQLAGDCAKKDYVARNIGIKLRFEDFRIVTRATTIAVATRDARVIRRIAGECLKRVIFERRIRLLGVRVANLASGSSVEACEEAARPFATRDLFDDAL